jgi:hypothetical protein
VHEHVVPGVEAHHLLGHVIRRAALCRQGDRHADVHVIGNRHRRAGVGERMRGVAAEARQRGYPLADLKVVHAGAERVDPPDNFVAEDRWHGRGVLIQSVPRRHIRIIEAERLDRDAQLTGGGFGRRRIAQLEGLRRIAGSYQVHRSHDCSSAAVLIGASPC